MNKIERITPKTCYKPVGDYSHITRIPAGMDTFVLSGQIGINEDGLISDSFNEEVSQTFRNISKVLASQGLDSDAITKVNIWSVIPIDWDYFYTEWSQLFKEEYPSMTIGYIDALGLPEINIEIEIWAAK